MDRQIRIPPMVGVPGFFLVRLGTILANVLPDLKIAKT